LECAREAPLSLSKLGVFEVRGFHERIWQDNIQPQDLSLIVHSAFPNPNNHPPFTPKNAVNSAVSLSINVNFCFPKLNVTFRALIAARTSVPKATINEDRNLLFRPTKIRRPFYPVMPSPAGKFLVVQNLEKLLLRTPVTTRFHSRHIP
jgi:hypothetical protein